MEFHEAMHLALEEAEKSGNDVPVGAILLSADGRIISRGHNKKELNSDAVSHAEIEVIRDAGHKLRNWRLEELTLYVTLEPCVMCAGAIVAARIPRVIFGAWDLKAGAAGSAYDILRDPRFGKPVEVVGGVEEEACSKLLESFFFSKRTRSPRLRRQGCC